MNSQSVMAKKLRNAINLKGHKITYSVTELFLPNNTFPSKLYTIKIREQKQANGKYHYEELFHTFTQIETVLFLRDYWHILNNIPLNNNNPDWNKKRKTIPALKELQKQQKQLEKVGE